MAAITVSAGWGHNFTVIKVKPASTLINQGKEIVTEKRRFDYEMQWLKTWF